MGGAATNYTIQEFWEVKYREQRREKRKIYNEYELDSVKKFVALADVTSIVFYANAFRDETSHKSTSKNRFYEKSLTKDELGTVSKQWFEEQRKEIKQALANMPVDKPTGQIH